MKGVRILCYASGISSGGGADNGVWTSGYGAGVFPYSAVSIDLEVRKKDGRVREFAAARSDLSLIHI